MGSFIQDDGSLRSARTSLTEPMSTLFPALPPLIEHVVIDSALTYEFMRPIDLSNNSASVLVEAAFALIVGRMTNTNSVTFGVSVLNEAVPVTINVSSEQNIQEYIQTLMSGPASRINGINNGITKQGSKFHTLLITNAPPNGPNDSRLGPYALNIQLQVGEAQTSFVADFDSRVLAAPIVKMLLQRLEVVLHQLNGSTPEQKLKDISLITSQDKEQIWAWNSIVPETIDRCVHDLIKEQADLRPDALAVNAWDGDLTYGELDKFASNIAGQLILLGIKPDMLVPVCFEKSRWTPVAVLAVLKAGGAFVLLDSTLPETRLQSVCEQTGSEVIVSSKDNMQLSSRLAKTVVRVDLESVQAHGSPIDKISQSSSTMMYSVFTSGSTGTPKGVVVSHANFCTALHHQLDLLQYNEESRAFDFASYAFDISTYNIIATLASGGCLCVPEEKDRKENLGGSIAAFRATTTGLTPTVARLLHPGALPTLKTVMLLGEAVSGEDAQPWWNTCSVLNVYGPAECVLTSINWTATCPEQVSSIGKGVGLVLWVVDPEDHNRLAPLGSVGELLMEGPLVSRGYLNKPEQTTKVFIEDPKFLIEGAPNHPGRSGRLYKSGDLVRYNEDGTLMYIGRKDTQVKIRGQRVELSEVEHHVQQCIPGVQQTVAEVIKPQQEGADPTLAVFVQMKRDEAEATKPDALDITILPISAEVYHQLESRLPIYMVPTVAFSMVDFPLTPTGKMDRKRLREIGSSFTISELVALQTAGQGTKRQPANATEKRMQEIWSKVLNIQTSMIGMDDSFASLGGNSITAMKATAAARTSSLSIRVADILRMKTISRIAEAIITNRADDSDGHKNGHNGNGYHTEENHADELQDSSIVPEQKEKAKLPAVGPDFQKVCLYLLGVQSEDIESISPCSPTQQYILKVQAEDDTNYRLCLGFDVELSGSDARLDISRLEQAWRDVVKSHGMLRAAIVQCSSGKSVMRHMVVLRNPEIGISHVGPGKEAKARDVRNNGGPFYRQNGPQHHLTICKINERKAFLQLQINHAVFDGYTIDILCQDLRAAYHGNLAQGGVYGDLVAHLQAQPQAPRLDFWNGHLADAYPTIFPLSSHSIEDCASSKGWKVPNLDSVKIREFCTELGIMNPILIHTAWSFVLSVYTGIKVPIFGTFCLGRDVPVNKADRTWGPFIGLIPYKVALNKPHTVADTLQVAQNDYLASLKYQHTALAELEKTPKFGGSRLCNSMITYQKAWGTGVSTEDPLTVNYVEEFDPNDFEVGVRPIESLEGFDIQLDFRVGCLSAAKAGRLAEDFGEAISSIINNPTMRFEDLKLRRELS